MIFYDCQVAPSPRRARMIIAEKGMDIETVQIDLGKGEQLDDDYKKINPSCTVPALKLNDGTVLCENIAIADYLESIQPQPPLIGTTAQERAVVLDWNARIELQGISALAEILRNSAKGFADRATTGPMNLAQIPELAERGRQRFQNFFPMLNEQLQGKEFVAGDFFSIADIAAFVTTEFAGWVKESVPEDCSAVQEWYARVKARPSASA
ncbi:MAG: glutathione S-transferase family protein [Pseudomonadales bacterium]